MNPLVKIILGAALVIGLAVVAINHHSDVKTEYDFQLAREAVRTEFLERAPAVRGVPDPAGYEDEQRNLLRWYFGALAELYNKYPQFRGADEKYLAELEALKVAGKLKGEEFDQKKANYEMVKEYWTTMKDGKYAAAMTGTDASLRMDFLEFTPAMVEGQKGIKGRFVLWGAPRRRVEEKVAGGLVQKKVETPVSFGDVSLKMVPAKDDKAPKVKAPPPKEGATTGFEFSFGLPAGPYNPYPERQIEDFPPMAFLGSFAFPLLPYEAANAEIDMTITGRSASGRDVVANLKWTREIPPEWRLKEGEKWEGAMEEERE